MPVENNKEPSKNFEKNMRWLKTNEYLFQSGVDYRIYAKFMVNSKRNPDGSEKYRYLYANSFDYSKWGTDLGISRNTVSKEFRKLIDLDVITIENPRGEKVYKVYNPDSKKDKWTKIHPIELEILLDNKVKSNTIKLYLHYRGWNGGVCYSNQKTLAKVLGLKQRKEFLEGKSDIEFSDKVLKSIGKMNKELEKLDLITVTRYKGDSNKVRCKYDTKHYMNMEVVRYEIEEEPDTVFM